MWGCQKTDCQPRKCFWDRWDLVWSKNGRGLQITYLSYFWNRHLSHTLLLQACCKRRCQWPTRPSTLCQVLTPRLEGTLWLDLKSMPSLATNVLNQEEQDAFSLEVHHYQTDFSPRFSRRHTSRHKFGGQKSLPLVPTRCSPKWWRRYSVSSTGPVLKAHSVWWGMWSIAREATSASAHSVLSRQSSIACWHRTQLLRRSLEHKTIRMWLWIRNSATTCALLQRSTRESCNKQERQSAKGRRTRDPKNTTSIQKESNRSCTCTVQKG